MTEQKNLGERHLKALTYFVVGVGSEGNLRGRDVSNRLSFAGRYQDGKMFPDGTMLIVGGKYVFRVRADDLTPVGHAPNLHVRDEADVKRVIDKANRSCIRNAHVFLTEELHLQ